MRLFGGDFEVVMGITAKGSSVWVLISHDMIGRTVDASAGSVAKSCMGLGVLVKVTVLWHEKMGS